MKTRGFTLIELLLATVIIGLLVSIAVPKFKGVRQRAYDAAAIEEIKALTVMAEAYFADWQVYPSAETDFNYVPAPGIVLTRWEAETVNGRAVVHIHLGHGASANYFHIRYPEDQIEKRTK